MAHSIIPLGKVTDGPVVPMVYIFAHVIISQPTMENYYGLISLVKMNVLMTYNYAQLREHKVFNIYPPGCVLIPDKTNAL